MVATGLWSRAEERVSRWHSQESAFFRRERERGPRGRSIQAREEKLRAQLERDFKGCPSI